MGKHEETRRIRESLDLVLRTKPLSTDAYTAITEHIYHRELVLKKVIQCLLALGHPSSYIEISLELLAMANGVVMLSNSGYGDSLQLKGDPLK